MTNTITKAALISDMRKVMKNGVLLRSTYRAKGNFASETVERNFGSWTSAVKRAKSGK